MGLTLKLVWPLAAIALAWFAHDAIVQRGRYLLEARTQFDGNVSNSDVSVKFESLRSTIQAHCPAEPLDCGMHILFVDSARGYPIVISPRLPRHQSATHLTLWIRANLKLVRDLHLLAGAILFRDFNVTDPVDFEVSINS